MSLRGFWTWIDNDFDSIRPLSLGLLSLLACIPLGIAFAVDANPAVVETARWIAIVAVLLGMAYYLYRASFVIARPFRTTFGQMKSEDRDDFNG